MARVTFRSEVFSEGDYKLVTRAQMAALIEKLERDPSVGKPLVRDLAGLRSTRCGGVENRAVYRILDEGGTDEVAEVIAIERRRDDEVYNEAAKRWTAL